MPTPNAKPSGTELFYLDDNGTKQDAALHAELLDNPEADRLIAERAVERAVREQGLDRATAQRLYGYRASPGT